MTDSPAPRRVLVVSHYFAAHGGGIERVAAQLMQDIAARYAVRFLWAATDVDPVPQGFSLAPAQGRAFGDDDKALAVLPMRGCNVLERAFGLPWPLWGPGSLRRLREAVAAADVVWLHDTLYPGNIVAFLEARRLKKPVLVTQHIGPVPYRNPVPRLLMRLADRCVTRPVLRQAGRVSFISDRVAEDYCRTVPFTVPVTVIPNGLDTRAFVMPAPENRRFLRQNFALRPEQPVFLFVGRFTEKKGLAVLRRLAALLPECRFWLAGSAALRRTALDPARWGLSNVHVFSGRQGQTLAELYQAADLLILPSYGEGFPLVIQEALACGLPVLCSPETAAGSRAAAPHVHQAPVWPDDPRRTAEVWAHKLRTFPLPLPLKAPEETLARFARNAWPRETVADGYAKLLDLAKKPPGGFTSPPRTF